VTAAVTVPIAPVSTAAIEAAASVLYAAAAVVTMTAEMITYSYETKPLRSARKRFQVESASRIAEFSGSLKGQRCETNQLNERK
jgi:hypothetical protein